MKFACCAVIILSISILGKGDLAVAHTRNVADPDSGYWQTQVAPFIGNNIRVLSVVDMNTCWMGGDSGKIIRTTDGGNSWSQLSVGISDSVDLTAMDAVSEKTAFAGLTHRDTTYILRTKDGGLSWDVAFSQAGGHIDGIKIYDGSTGIAAGDPVGGTWTVAKTSDSGSTWTRMITEPPQLSGRTGGNGFGTYDTTQIWFFDRMGGTYWSSDGGASWSHPADTTPVGAVTRLMWMNDWTKHDYSMLAIFGDNIFGTNGFGYQLLGSPPLGIIIPVTGLVGAASTTEFWFVQDLIYYVPDFCINCYSESPPNGLNKHATLIDMVTLGSGISAWATGIGDTVYHYNRTITATADHPQLIPKAFKFSQNFPNPFNPSTTIHFELPKASHVHLELFNVLGQSVLQILDERRQAGTYDVKVNAINLSSGIYFYRIVAGDFVQTRKMVLMK